MSDKETIVSSADEKEISFPVPHNMRNQYSWDKRMEVVSRYMLLGNVRVVSEQTGVANGIIYEWKKSDWWPEMVEQLRRQAKSKTNNSLTKVIENSLEIVQERLENGDFIFNNKTGEVMRKPVGIKEAGIIANNLIQRQVQIEQLMEKTNEGGESVKETLELLAKEFQKLNKKKQEVVDVEIVSMGET